MDGSCCIGIELNEECHKISYCSEKGFVVFADYSESEKKLIELRSGVLIKEDGTVCLHHEALYLKKYEWLQKHCCDPYKVHKKAVSSEFNFIFMQSVNFKARVS